MPSSDKSLAGDTSSTGSSDGHFSAPVGTRLKGSSDDGSEFEIIGWLGQGAYATVWLAMRCVEVHVVHGCSTVDASPTRLASGTAKGSCVAIKVLSLFATKLHEENDHQELKTFLNVTKGDINHPGRRYCLELIAFDTFTSPQTEGQHSCFVTDLCGPTLTKVMKDSPFGNYMIVFPYAARIISQVALALQYLHDIVGVVHAGKYSAIYARRANL